MRGPMIDLHINTGSHLSLQGEVKGVWLSLEAFSSLDLSALQTTRTTVSIGQSSIAHIKSAKSLTGTLEIDSKVYLYQTPRSIDLDGDGEITYRLRNKASKDGPKSDRSTKESSQI